MISVTGEKECKFYPRCDLCNSALLYAVLPTLLFPLLALSLASRYLSTESTRFLPRRFFYLSYGGHLLLLGLVRLALK